MRVHWVKYHVITAENERGRARRLFSTPLEIRWCGSLDILAKRTSTAEPLAAGKVAVRTEIETSISVSNNACSGKTLAEETYERRDPLFIPDTQGLIFHFVGEQR